jgi:hypothetical protein
MVVAHHLGRGHLTVLALAALAASGCTHWVVIRSTPAGALAKVDGVDMGQTPFFFEETTGWSKVYRLELHKDGYEPFATPLEQNSLQFKHACPAVCLGPLTGGLSLAGCMFSYGLADEYNFVMTPLDDGQRFPVPDPVPGDLPPPEPGLPSPSSEPVAPPKQDVLPF